MFEFIGESLWFCLFVPPKFRGRLVETPEPDVFGGSEDAGFIIVLVIMMKILRILHFRKFFQDLSL